MSTERLTDDQLRDFLDAKALQYQTPDFVADDPVSLPHRFADPDDIAIAGLLVATISWGNRKAILASADALMNLMDNAPADFVRNATEADIERASRFYYRTFNGTDLRGMIAGLHAICLAPGGLRAIFATPPDGSVRDAIARFRTTMLPHIEQRTRKHIADAAAGAAAKRINMFLRWMVRSPKAGVDFGIWADIISPARLMLPLDVHTANTGRALGLLARRQNDWKAVEEITARLRAFCPEDPVKYDFALFGLGIYEHFK